jgi:hypothetical protein
MTTWASVVPEVVMYVADCPSWTIQEQVRSAAIDYFRTTRLWRSTTPLTLATTVAGQGTYTIAGAMPYVDVEVAGLPALWLDNVEIGEALGGALNNIYPGQTGTGTIGSGTGQVTSGYRVQVALVDGTSLQFLPAPDTAGQVLKGQVAFRPTEAAAGIPDTVYALYGRTIRNLAISRLMTMQGKPWSDAKGAMQWRGDYLATSMWDSTQQGARRRTALRTKKANI